MASLRRPLLSLGRLRHRPCTQHSIRFYSFHPSPDPAGAPASSSTTPTAIADIPRPKATLHTLRQLYKKQIPIATITAHDFPSALAADQAGTDLILIGDSLAMVALGYTSTNQVTMEDMIHHSKAVVRGTKSAYVVADLPFGTYEASPEDAVRNAAKLIREGGVEAVKLEGGKEMAVTIERLTRVGIPVMGHIGLLPQRQAALGGFRVQGKTAASAAQLLEDAVALEKAGCFAIVLEAMPAEIAEIITKRITVPTIGIGAGSACSGQVLVQLDMLGAFERFVPKFVKQYESIGVKTRQAIGKYVEEVKARSFPAVQHTYPIKPEELEKFKVKVGSD
ncbi:hypothetical protein G7K_1098-t1 [Saitoella complicata NRRL Y-17804]|uniref:3-methyl-2-oxobutanoate hydroxymethyltransferase n=1 Tax=Saitoella complicata (strain BCRC 22490 / CBS 7301 / JCM 7358 / NBRC 10748 / NRRL Y-17804) TaxID=698492 RepID=A0A0E9NBX3_SAICN|nr:hypothetical protein G7K_1098-t1 [Saitoella complicata NRRL Y-17804]